MLDVPPRESEKRSWLWVGLWTLLIYATVPFVRTIQFWITDHFGNALFSMTVYVAAAVALIVAATGLLRGQGLARPARLLWLVAVAAICAWHTSRMKTSPEEAIHFIEYGALTLLIFRAFSHRIRDPSIYIASVLVCLLLGTVDEIIQWITPIRYWDFRDVGLNVEAGLLMILAIAKGIRPAFITRPVRPTGVRIACRLAAMNFVLLILCVSNTPQRKAMYEHRWPALARIDEAMIEYGFRIHDPEAGTFYSRFTADELRRIDAERGPEAAQILDAYQPDRRYDAFLKTYPPIVDPFLHEARVHLFRRDRYDSEARRQQNDETKFAACNTVAYRENQILEKYFHDTLHSSSYLWSPETMEAAGAAALTNRPYVSPVSRQLITVFNERQLWGLLVTGMLVAGFVYRYGGHRLKREEERLS